MKKILQRHQNKLKRDRKTNGKNIKRKVWFSKEMLQTKNSDKKRKKMEKRDMKIQEFKANAPDPNSINLTKKTHSASEMVTE